MVYYVLKKRGSGEERKKTIKLYHYSFNLFLCIYFCPLRPPIIFCLVSSPTLTKATRVSNIKLDRLLVKTSRNPRYNCCWQLCISITYIVYVYAFQLCISVTYIIYVYAYMYILYFLCYDLYVFSIL